MKPHLFALPLLLSLTSCATIRHGKYQQVAFTSDPSGAYVYVNNQLMGQTPACVCLKRSDPYTVQIELEGYKPYLVQLRPTVSGWFFGNILFGGVVGIAVDAVTGSMYKLTPNQLNACLMSEGEVITHIREAEDCEVVILSTVDPSWEKIGELDKN